MWYHGAKKVQKRAQKKQQQSVIYEWGVNLPDCTIVDFGFGRCYGVFSMCLKKKHLAHAQMIRSMIFSDMSKEKSFTLKPSLKSSGWAGLVPTDWGEVYSTNDEVFFCFPGFDRDAGELWRFVGRCRSPLCISLCFIIEDDSSTQHKKHTENHHSHRRQTGEGERLCEGRVTYQSGSQ